MSHFITKKGLQDLEKELQNLMEVLLPKVFSDINSAREEGDLKENAGYQTALKVKDELLARQEEIEEVLKDYTIIEEDVSGNTKTVQIGQSVRIKYLVNNEEYVLQIVGVSESDAINNKISNESPLAQSILGKKVGSSQKFKAPSGKIEVKILEIL